MPPPVDQAPTSAGSLVAAHRATCTRKALRGHRSSCEYVKYSCRNAPTRILVLGHHRMVGVVRRWLSHSRANGAPLCSCAFARNWRRLGRTRRCVVLRRPVFLTASSTFAYRFPMSLSTTVTPFSALSLPAKPSPLVGEKSWSNRLVQRTANGKAGLCASSSAVPPLGAAYRQRQAS